MSSKTRTMAKKSKSDSTLASSSRPDSELFNRSPLAVDAGVVIWLDQFVKAVPIENLGLCCQDETQMRAAFTALFYITDPRSLYCREPEKDRPGIVIENNIAPEQRAFITKLITGKEFKIAQVFYLRLVTTSQERLSLALQKQVDRYTDLVSSMDNEANSKTGKELLDCITFAQDATERLRQLQAFLREERKSRARSDYESKLFENKTDS